MGYLTVLLLAVFVGCVVLQNRTSRFIKTTSFSCEGRPSGYYADVETGCQVYHMCDGLGRQFSYSCPNTTLFQQRMLICDHWYMVNCSRSTSQYHRNLLIGQRDKAFVNDDDESQRTPRPNLVSYEYQQDESNLNTVSNLIGGFQDQVKKSTPEVYFLPSHWSTELSTKVKTTTEIPTQQTDTKTQQELRNDRLRPTIPREDPRSRLRTTQQPTTIRQVTERFQTTEASQIVKDIKPPSRLFEPPFETSNPNIIEKLQSKVLAQTALTLQSLRRDQTTTEVPTTEPPKRQVITTEPPKQQLRTTEPPKQQLRTTEFPKPVSTIKLPTLIISEPPNDLLPPKLSSPNLINQLTPIKVYNFTSKIAKEYPPQSINVPLQNPPKQPDNDLEPPTLSNSNQLKVYNFTSKIAKEFPPQPINVPLQNPPKQPSNDLVPPTLSNQLTPIKVYNFTSKIAKEYPPQPINVPLQNPPKQPANDLVPPFLSKVETKGVERLPPPTELLPPKPTARKVVNDSVVAPSRIVQEPFLVYSRKNFLIPSFNLPLEDKVTDTKFDENHLSSYQVNPAGEVNEFNKISWLNYLSTHDKSSLNSDCPNCDPNLLIPGTCQPCILVKR